MISAEATTDARCAWCGGPARAGADGIAGCTSCRAGTTYPPPGEAELDAAYAGWYRPDGGRFAGPGERVLRRARATLAQRIDERAPAGPVLDVGAGDGVLLAALRARGREATGLEREARAGGIQAGELTDFREREGGWAAIVLWHVLEHLRAPAAAVDRACALLAPGGLLIVAVPNLGSWQARRFGANWFALDLPRHLVHLPAAALLAGLGARGLAIERVSYWRGGQVVFGWLHGLVGSLPGRPDLYEAIRRPDARATGQSGRLRGRALLAGVALLPLAMLLSALEVAARAGGTVYVEARRP